MAFSYLDFTPQDSPRSEHPDLVVDVSVHCSGVGLDDKRVPSNSNDSMILRIWHSGDKNLVISSALCFPNCHLHLADIRTLITTSLWPPQSPEKAKHPAQVRSPINYNSAHGQKGYRKQRRVFSHSACTVWLQPGVSHHAWPPPKAVLAHSEGRDGDIGKVVTHSPLQGIIFFICEDIRLER